jgi:hypothetical protein
VFVTEFADHGVHLRVKGEVSRPARAADISVNLQSLPLIRMDVSSYVMAHRICCVLLKFPRQFRVIWVAIRAGLCKQDGLTSGRM